MRLAGIYGRGMLDGEMTKEKNKYILIYVFIIQYFDNA